MVGTSGLHNAHQVFITEEEVTVVTCSCVKTFGLLIHNRGGEVHYAGGLQVFITEEEVTGSVPF